MIRRTPRSTRTDTLFPYTTLFRSASVRLAQEDGAGAVQALHLRPSRRQGPVDDAEAGEEMGGKRAQGSLGHPFLRLRSEEHTSELQSLMRISYAVFCLKKKTKNQLHHNIQT